VEEKEADWLTKATERRDRRALSHTAQIQAFAVDGMKAPALVAAAGVAAVLGFYSANYQRLSETAGKLAIFNDILFWLFLSLLMTVCAPGLAYFSQIAYVRAIYSESFEHGSGFTVETKASKRWEAVGDFFRWGTVTFIACSILFLCIGGFRFLALVGR